MTTISPLPPVPQPADDVSTFNTKAFALVAALAQLVTETNAVAGEINTASASAASDAAAALASKVAALASENAAQANAMAAAASAGAPRWVSGQLYDDGEVVWGPEKGRIYRRIGAGSGVLDPHFDTAHWLLLSPINDPTALAITYDSQGRPQLIEETVGANLRQTTSTYNADGTVATVVIVFGGVTRTETYSYTSGRLTGMTATEA